MSSVAVREHARVAGLVAGTRGQEPAALFAALFGRCRPLGLGEALCAAIGGNDGGEVGELLCLQGEKLIADLTAVVAANGRAQSLSEAERAAAAEQGREQRRRFLTPGTGYQPGNAQMFHGN